MDQILDVSRKEIKYLISTLRAQRLNALLSQILRQDPHNGHDGYLVRTLYFDTVYDDDYQDKEDGLLYRKKVRIRIYSPNDDFAKLELKEKINTNQRKRSLLISKADVYKLISGEYSCLLSYDNSFAQEVYSLMAVKNYIPRCVVEYNRRAFILDENNIRVTLDSKIRATEGDLDIFKRDLFLYPVIHIDHVTLEVKYDRFMLSYVKDLLSLQDSLPISNSKYSLARSVGHTNHNLYL